jgi:hypothetical protein
VGLCVSGVESPGDRFAFSLIPSDILESSLCRAAWRNCTWHSGGSGISIPDRLKLTTDLQPEEDYLEDLLAHHLCRACRLRGLS